MYAQVTDVRKLHHTLIRGKSRTVLALQGRAQMRI